MKKNIGDQIIEKLRQGMPHNSIVKELQVSKSTVSYHANKNGFGHGKQKKHDWNEVQLYLNEGHFINECLRHFHISRQLINKKIKSGEIIIKKNRNENIDGISFLEYASKNEGKRNPRIQTILRAKILKEGLIPYICRICGIDTWQGKSLTLRLDHINGKKTCHILTNLGFICPNCDSQQDTYHYRNRYKNKLVRSE